MGKMEYLTCVQHPLDAGYTQISTRFDADCGALWTLMHPDDVPCFTLNLLNELHHHHQSIANCGGNILAGGELHPIRYSVVASHTPGVFNLGGQLALFSQLIRDRDHESLMQYATKCIDVMMPRINHFSLSLATISLIQGDALGGGLESALTSDVIIAERRSKMGFPEILFNLFPGMGAYSLVARKIGVAQAEKMILSGRIYSAEELHALGLVDVLAEDGEGEEAVHDYIRRQARYSNGYLAVQRARQRFNPVTYQELMDITTIWADAALLLTEKDLKVMNRLIRSQQKLFGQEDQIQRPSPIASEAGMALTM